MLAYNTPQNQSRQLRFPLKACFSEFRNHRFCSHNCHDNKPCKDRFFSSSFKVTHGSIQLKVYLEWCQTSMIYAALKSQPSVVYNLEISSRAWNSFDHEHRRSEVLLGIIDSPKERFEELFGKLFVPFRFHYVAGKLPDHLANIYRKPQKIKLQN